MSFDTCLDYSKSGNTHLLLYVGYILFPSLKILRHFVCPGLGNKNTSKFSPVGMMILYQVRNVNSVIQLIKTKIFAIW